MIDLMIPPIVAALVILSIHAYLGLHVIGREVIFVDLAFAQIAALGTTVAFLLGFDHGTTLSLLFALGFTFGGALVFSVTRMEKSAVPQEAIIGITFVVASAAVILLSGFTAEGTEHLRDTMTGTLIWVDWRTIGSMAGIYAVLGIFHFVLRRKFLTVTFKPERARNIRFWDFLFYASFGIVISYLGRDRRRADGLQLPGHSSGHRVLLHGTLHDGAAHRVAGGHDRDPGRHRRVVLLGRGDRAAARVLVRHRPDGGRGSSRRPSASSRPRRSW